MNKSNFINVRTGKIPGRGADHQIDSYGEFCFSPPFIYPIRLISEAKWFGPKHKVELKDVRSFLGVVLDISQNYFAPRGRDRNNPNLPELKDRYTDCGAFFSATGFTADAQQFSWAHGIFLESFTNDVVLEKILERATYLLSLERNWLYSNTLTKEDVVKMANRHFNEDLIMQNLLQFTSAYIGLLDGIYPVMLTSRGELKFDARAPDNIGNELDFTANTAFKERRVEGEQDVNFQFRFRTAFFNFSLPAITASKLVQAIDRTYGGEAFGYLDFTYFVECRQRGI